MDPKHIFEPSSGREEMEKSLEDDQRIIQADAPRDLLYNPGLITVIKAEDDPRYVRAVEMLGLSPDDFFLD